MRRRVSFSKYWKKNKYNAVRKKCKLGHDHRSRLESEYCAILQIGKKLGELQEFIFEKRYTIEVNGIKICDMYPDFTVQMKNGATEIHETKGVETDVWRLKWKLMQALYPDFVYYVIK